MSAPIPAPSSVHRLAAPRHAHYDVVVVGAGIAGCAVAQGLARADGGLRRKILLVDLHVGPSPRFSGEFIHPRGVQVLDQLSLLQPLLQAGAVLADGFAVFDDQEHRCVELNYRDLIDPAKLDLASKASRSASGLGVHHQTLIKVLRAEVARHPNVEVCEGWKAVGLAQENGRTVGISLQGKIGRDAVTVALKTDLIVAADGKASPVRKLASIDDARRSLGFTAGLCVHQARTPAPRHAAVMVGAPGPILCYPIERHVDGTVSYRLTFDMPQTHLPARGRELGRYVQQVFFPVLPPELAAQCEAALRAANGQLELAPTFDLPAVTASHPGLVLVGDAAGCSHPVTASGMTMALLDAHTLHTLALTRSHEDDVWLDDAIGQRYRVVHDRYVPTRQALADAIFEALRGEDEAARAIRRALFDYWEASAENRQHSLALLACDEARPRVFLGEYLKTAKHALAACLLPRYAPYQPWADRLHALRATSALASAKLRVVANVTWAQVRPWWFPQGAHNQARPRTAVHSSHE